MYRATVGSGSANVKRFARDFGRIWAAIQLNTLTSTRHVHIVAGAVCYWSDDFAMVLPVVARAHMRRLARQMPAGGSMEYRPLGPTGLVVSGLAYGAPSLGGAPTGIPSAHR
jgi:hypothetical protein